VKSGVASSWRLPAERPTYCIQKPLRRAPVRSPRPERRSTGVDNTMRADAGFSPSLNFRVFQHPQIPVIPQRRKERGQLAPPERLELPGARS
jgi:hypothetical protein